MVATPSYCWLSVETTGLHPRLDHILEVAIVVTGPDLIELTGLSMIVNPALGRHGQGWEDRMDDHVRRMHTSSGLLREVIYAPSLAHVDEAMVAMVVPVVEYDVKVLTCPRVTSAPEALSVSTKLAVPFSE